MSKDCDIVKDLIIGYKENSLRENSISFVEEHIKSCIECKNYLKMVEDDIEEENNKIENDKNIDFFKSINKVINKNKKFVKGLVVVVIILLTIVIVSCIINIFDFFYRINEYAGYIVISDKIKKSATKLKELTKKLNKELIILSGDINGFMFELINGGFEVHFDKYAIVTIGLKKEEVIELVRTIKINEEK